jgi:heme/copper-type cytochrome/quinol oxidase subunit 2
MPRSVQGLGIALYALFGVLILIDVAAIAVAIHRKSLFERILTDGDFTIREADLSDTLSFLVAVLQVAVSVAVIVVWLIWFHRARVNAERYGNALRHGTGWAIGAWFVPVLNMVRPKAITDDIARASDPQLLFAPKNPLGLPRPPLITVWWIAWLIDNAASRVYINGTRSDDPVKQPGILKAEIVVTLLDIVTVVLAILVVVLITNRQQRKNDLMAQQVGRPAVAQ